MTQTQFRCTDRQQWALSTMTPIEVLKEARALLTPPEAWTKGRYARDRFGFPREPYSKDAACFCLLGAICKVAKTPHIWPEKGTGQSDAISILIEVLPANYGDLIRFNDLSTHEEVLALLDRGIASAT